MAEGYTPPEVREAYEKHEQKQNETKPSSFDPEQYLGKTKAGRISLPTKVIWLP